MKVLQICHKLPYPAVDGGAQVIHFTTEALLNAGISVNVLAINPTRNYINENQLPLEYRKKTKFESVKVDTRIKPIRFLTSIFRDKSYFIERFISDDVEVKLRNTLQSEQFDIVQLEHLYLCMYIPVIRNFSKAKIVLRPQNIEYEIWQRYLKGIKNPLMKFLLKVNINRLKKFEQQVNPLVDGIAALTKEDADLFYSFAEPPRIVVVPMGYDYKRLITHPYNVHEQGRPCLYHLASMDWLPNQEAVKWLLEEVMPLLKGAGIHLILAGKKMPEWVYARRSEEIEVMDEINEPLKFQQDKAILVVPLLSGSGIRAKIIEGMALGKAIISTTIGAQGIEYESGKHFLIADTPRDFADQILKCVASAECRKKLGENARELGWKKYRSEVSSQTIIDFYHQLLGFPKSD